MISLRVACFSVLAAALPSAGVHPAAPPPVTVTCTFENPSYPGSCVEATTRTGRETAAAACKPILDCLNNPLCSKSYCKATSIRQGWTLKSTE